jgi:hypothetical protein
MKILSAKKEELKEILLRTMMKRRIRPLRSKKLNE